MLLRSSYYYYWMVLWTASSSSNSNSWFLFPTTTLVCHAQSTTTTPSAGKLRSQAEEALSGGNAAQALVFLQQATVMEPENPVNYYRLFKVHTRQKQPLAALDDITQAIVLATNNDDKQSTSYTIAKAKLLVQLGQCDQAVAQHETLPQEHRDVPAYETAQTCAQIMAEAERAAFEKDFRTAATQFGRALQYIEYTAANPDVLWRKAQALMELQDYYGVVSDTGKLLKASPAHLEAYYLRGKAFYQLHEHEQAILHFRQALRQDPEHALNKEGHKLVKKCDKAAAKAESLLATDVPAAIQQYQKARKIDPTHALFNTHMTKQLIKAYSKDGQHTEAIREATKLTTDDPDSIEALWALAEAQQEADQYEPALRTFQQAYEQAPENSDLERQAKEKVQQAQVALKQSKEKNYYKILGIPRTVTAKEIKSAYRKLALQWHPDKVTEEQKEEASTKFQDIGEAYEVLSDEELRAKYDRGEPVFENQGGGGGGHHTNPFQFFNQQFHQQGGGGGRQRVHHGGGGQQRVHFRYG